MHARLAQLERATRTVCHVCGEGGDPSQMCFTLLTVPAARAVAQPCVACGRVPISFTLVVGPPLKQEDECDT
jgi:hypothetical protein